jgi:hypothetical protein
MKAQLFGTALAFIANIAFSQAFYSDRDDVLSLTTKNFGSAILDTDVSICNLYRLEYTYPYYLATCCSRILRALVWPLSEVSLSL